MASDINFFLVSFSLFVTFYTVGGLECYTCVNQDSNKDKCIKTSMQCMENQDYCMAIIRWGIPPYWTPRGQRSYFIDKNCTTQKECESIQKTKYLNSCKRDWFLDWACIDCCSGDLCNYYVTLGSSRVSVNWWSLLTLIGVSTFIRYIAT